LHAINSGQCTALLAHVGIVTYQLVGGASHTCVQCLGTIYQYVAILQYDSAIQFNAIQQYIVNILHAIRNMPIGHIVIALHHITV